MHRLFPLLLAAALLLCGCTELIPARTTVDTMQYHSPSPQSSVSPAVSEEPLPSETEVPETEPPTEAEPVYFNPLNGQILDAPWDKRIFAFSISNIRDALPHVSVNDADIFIESFVNGSIVRGLALFTDPSDISAIGSVRSDRMMFNDLCQLYDAVMIHAGGSSKVLRDANDRGLSHINVDGWPQNQTISVRDQDRNRRLGYEHCLLAIGGECIKYAQENGLRTDMAPDKDYLLRFTDDGTPAGGQDARDINIHITFQNYVKYTAMHYLEDLGKYQYHQWDKDMFDDITGEPEAFTNVLILLGEFTIDSEYQRCNFTKGGIGWYACGGKAVPVEWFAEDEYSPLAIYTETGKPLVMQRGNTYIALTEDGSEIEWS